MSYRQERKVLITATDDTCQHVAFRGPAHHVKSTGREDLTADSTPQDGQPVPLTAQEAPAWTGFLTCGP